MKQTLYQIEQDYLSLINEIEESDGELSQEVQDALVINEGQLKQKSISYLEVIKTKEAFNKNVDEEIKRLQAIKKRNNTLVNRLNSTLLDAVNLFGEFEVGTLTFTTRKSESVLIDDQEQISEDYKVNKVVTSVDRLAIKKAIKEGKEVKGATLQENKSLRVK